MVRGRMLRFAELALFIAPFAGFLAWRLLAVEGGPPLWLVIGAACVLLVLAGALFWLRQEESLPGTVYVPAQMQDGRIVPAHSATP